MKKSNETNESIIFCHNVKLLRVKYGFTKKQMADIIGVSAYTLNQIESCTCPVRLKTHILLNISKYFHISIEALISSRLNECSFENNNFFIS